MLPLGQLLLLAITLKLVIYDVQHGTKRTTCNDLLERKTEILYYFQKCDLNAVIYSTTSLQT